MIGAEMKIKGIRRKKGDKMVRALRKECGSLWKTTQLPRDYFYS
jgi:hypothetical protein